MSVEQVREIAKRVANNSYVVHGGVVDVPEKKVSWPKLGDLTVAHMSESQRIAFDGLITAVRSWRERVANGEKVSFMILSDCTGIGKTHIAQAVIASFSEIVKPDDDKIKCDESLLVHGKFLTARDVMDICTESQAKIHRKVDKIVVIDDVGREGVLPFIRQGDGGQEREIANRYYMAFNGCYTDNVPIFMTSNMTYDEIKKFFNDATWSRLMQMCPKGCIYELFDIPDFRVMAGGR